MIAEKRSLREIARDAVRRSRRTVAPVDPRLMRIGETLADATARRWGIPLARRPRVNPADVMHPARLDADGHVVTWSDGTIIPPRRVLRTGRNRAAVLADRRFPAPPRLRNPRPATDIEAAA